MPQSEAGRITEPPVCVPLASGTMKSATAAAEPADETPGVRFRSCGLRVMVGQGQANSVVRALPRMTAPCWRSRATVAESFSGRKPG